jgi:hypothetical protein
MYSGKIAVPPGGGGLSLQHYLSTTLFKLSDVLSANFQVKFSQNGE